MMCAMSTLIAVLLLLLLCAVSSAERQEFCSNPGLAIPPSGDKGCCTQDSIVTEVSGYSSVRDVRMNVNLTHTWIGDLSITIKHEESGISVTLFLFQCGNSDDLYVAFSDDAPEALDCTAHTGGHTYSPVDSLDAFDGLQATTHTWTISVGDNRNNDFGILQSWCLSFDSETSEPQYVASSQREEQCRSPGSRIPVSGNSGCCTEDSIVTYVSSDLEMKAFQVIVNLKHTRLEDLAISLRNGESGQSVALFVQECGDSDDLSLTYTDHASERLDCDQRKEGLTFVPRYPLAVFDGFQGYNTWTLSIGDSFTNNVGTLTSWCLSYATEALPPSEDAIKQQTECALDLDKVISSNATSSITHSLAAGRSLKNVEISVNLDHEKTDLVITVSHEESGKSVILYNRNCPDDRDLDIVFSDSASKALTATGACTNHDQGTTFRPSGALSAKFDELSYTTNTWKLFIENEAGSQYSGTLHDWCVTFDHSVPRFVITETTATSMGDARAMCQDQFGTDLAVIRDSEQQLEALRICTATGSHHCWIGLEDYDGNDVFTWIDGTQLTYDNWARIEPDNDYYDCVYLYYADGYWWVRNCDQSGYRPLCRNPAYNTASIS